MRVKEHVSRTPEIGHQTTLIKTGNGNKHDVKTNIFPLQKVSKKSKTKIVSCNKYQKCFVKTKSFKKYVRYQY